jgi:hypothetical protein
MLFKYWIDSSTAYPVIVQSSSIKRSGWISGIDSPHWVLVKVWKWGRPDSNGWSRSSSSSSSIIMMFGCKHMYNSYMVKLYIYIYVIIIWYNIIKESFFQNRRGYPPLSERKETPRKVFPRLLKIARLRSGGRVLRPATFQLIDLSNSALNLKSWSAGWPVGPQQNSLRESPVGSQHIKAGMENPKILKVIFHCILVVGD